MWPSAHVVREASGARLAKAMCMGALGHASRMAALGHASIQAVFVESTCLVELEGLFAHSVWPDVVIAISMDNRAGRVTPISFRAVTPFMPFALDYPPVAEVSPSAALDELARVAALRGRLLRAVGFCLPPDPGDEVRDLAHGLDDYLRCRGKRPCVLVEGDRRHPALATIVEVLCDGSCVDRDGFSIIATAWHRADGPRLCEHVVFTRRLVFAPPFDDDSSALFHLCDGAHHLVPAEAMPIVRALRGGVGSGELCGAESGHTEADIVAFIAELAEARLLAHERGHASLIARLLAGLHRYPAYRERGRFADLTDLPLVTARDIGVAERDYMLDGQPPKEEANASFHVAVSSSSSGQAPHVTILEIDEQVKRIVWRHAVDDAPPIHRAVSISRPANLQLADPGIERIAIRRGSYANTGDRAATLELATHANPTLVSTAAWDELLDLVAEFEPDFLDGDPAIIAGLAHRTVERGVRFPTIRRVELVHNHAWRVYRAVIDVAFGVRTVLRLGSSECWTTAIDCAAGSLHLLEQSIVYELLCDGGRPARPGELAGVVLTTLDATIAPLVRYVSGDVVRERACACGHSFRSIRFAGRLRDLFLDSRGELVTYDLIDDALGELGGAAYFRLQLDHDSAMLSIVPSATMMTSAIDDAARRLAIVIGRDVQVAEVDHLPLVGSGKLSSLAVPDRTATWSRMLFG